MLKKVIASSMLVAAGLFAVGPAAKADSTNQYTFSSSDQNTITTQNQTTADMHNTMFMGTNDNFFNINTSGGGNFDSGWAAGYPAGRAQGMANGGINNITPQPYQDDNGYSLGYHVGYMVGWSNGYNLYVNHGMGTVPHSITYPEILFDHITNSMH